MLTAQNDNHSAVATPPVSGASNGDQNSNLSSPSLQDQMNSLDSSTELTNVPNLNTVSPIVVTQNPSPPPTADSTVDLASFNQPDKVAPAPLAVPAPVPVQINQGASQLPNEKTTEPVVDQVSDNQSVQALAEQVADQLNQDQSFVAEPQESGNVTVNNAPEEISNQVQAQKANEPINSNNAPPPPVEVSNQSLPTPIAEATSSSSPVVPAATPLDPSSNPSPNSNSISTNTFFDVLMAKGKISQEQAQSLIEENLNSGDSLEKLILDKKLVSLIDITQAKAEFYKIDYIDLSAVGADPEALNLIDEVIAKRYKVLPFALDEANNTVKVAMADPLDLSAIEFLKQKTGHEIKAYFAEPSELERSVAERYSQSLSTEVTEALKTTNQYQVKKQEGVSIDTSGQILRDAPINRIVENILDFAIKSRASDIHIEPQIGRIRVRYRIDGILVEKLILPKSVHDAIASRIKILSHLKIDEKRLPQDGRFNYVSQGKEVDLRISTLPTVHGEKVVMRLLEKNTTVPSLEELGLTGFALRNLKDKIKVPHGIILITGPTGSGKTTTLYSILHIVNGIGVNIMTLEDPVEYQISGVNQVQVNVKAGLTFASGLRSFLRQDPNIIMVGEIRDNETADLAIQASLTGHLVFSTLHTNSAAGALPRLMDMQAEPFLLASSMLLSMAQRVVRKINPKYVEEYKPEPAVIEDIKRVLGANFENWCRTHNKKPEDITLFRAKENRPSTEPEYKGRIGIFEVMPITQEVSKLILERASSDEIEKMAVKQGMLLMKQDGFLKALDGVTTIEEVLRVAEVQ